MQLCTAMPMQDSLWLSTTLVSTFMYQISLLKKMGFSSSQDAGPGYTRNRTCLQYRRYWSGEDLFYLWWSLWCFLLWRNEVGGLNWCLLTELGRQSIFLWSKPVASHGCAMAWVAKQSVLCDSPAYDSFSLGAFASHFPIHRRSSVFSPQPSSPPPSQWHLGSHFAGVLELYLRFQDSCGLADPAPWPRGSWSFWWRSPGKNSSVPSKWEGWIKFIPILDNLNVFLHLPMHLLVN